MLRKQKKSYRIFASKTINVNFISKGPIAGPMFIEYFLLLLMSTITPKIVFRLE